MIDLFEPRMPEDKLHESFRLIRQDPAYAPVMPVIQGWAAGLLERRREGDKFVKELQSTFNSAMWEIYLNRALMELGFEVDFSKSAPDFCVTTPGGYRFNIEAVISDRSPSAPTIAGLSEQDFKIQSALKLIGKLNDKVRLYRGDGGKKYPYGVLEHVREAPFVVAIAPFDSDLSLTQNNELINLVLFGLGAPSHEADTFGHQERVARIQKKPGTEIDVGIFTNDSFKEISAVIFSTTGTFGKAVIESGIDRLVRSSRYRVIDKDLAQAGDPSWSLGEQYLAQGKLDFLKRYRWEDESLIYGMDVRICSSRVHRETHLDGLHIYYNPYAEHPLDPGTFWSAEISHNSYDVAADEPQQDHPDGALISRQVHAPNSLALAHLLHSYGFIR
ncbi:hypothetical protein HUW63_32415 [Myxococcus sp. AM001]|nr:hypothetical protein [Myxococcus sp. AM001]